MNRLLAFFFRLLSKVVTLPTTLAEWVKVIPISRVLIYVMEAERIAGLSGEAKRKYVAECVSAWAKSKGYVVPASVINWLIETAVVTFQNRTMPRP